MVGHILWGYFLKCLKHVETVSPQSPQLSGLQAIHAAAIAGHADVVEILVEHGADPNSRHGFAGNSPLLIGFKGEWFGVG